MGVFDDWADKFIELDREVKGQSLPPPKPVSPWGDYLKVKAKPPQPLPPKPENKPPTGGISTEELQAQFPKPPLAPPSGPPKEFKASDFFAVPKGPVTEVVLPGQQQVPQPSIVNRAITSAVRAPFSAAGKVISTIGAGRDGGNPTAQKIGQVVKGVGEGMTTPQTADELANQNIAFQIMNALPQIGHGSDILGEAMTGARIARSTSPRVAIAMTTQDLIRATEAAKSAGKTTLRVGETALKAPALGMMGVAGDAGKAAKPLTKVDQVARTHAILKDKLVGMGISDETSANILNNIYRIDANPDEVGAVLTFEHLPSRLKNQETVATIKTSTFNEIIKGHSGGIDPDVYMSNMGPLTDAGRRELIANAQQQAEQVFSTVTSSMPTMKQLREYKPTPPSPAAAKEPWQMTSIPIKPSLPSEGELQAWIGKKPTPKQSELLSKLGYDVQVDKVGKVTSLKSVEVAPPAAAKVTPPPVATVPVESIRYDPSVNRYNGQTLTRGDLLVDTEGTQYILDRANGFMLSVDKRNAKGGVDTFAFSVDPFDKTRFKDLQTTGTNVYGASPEKTIPMNMVTETTPPPVVTGLTPEQQGLTRVYRAEKNVHPRPVVPAQGTPISAYPKKGLWFTTDLKEATTYGDKVYFLDMPQSEVAALLKQNTEMGDVRHPTYLSLDVADASRAELMQKSIAKGLTPEQQADMATNRAVKSWQKGPFPQGPPERVAPPTMPVEPLKPAGVVEAPPRPPPAPPAKPPAPPIPPPSGVTPPTAPIPPAAGEVSQGVADILAQAKANVEHSAPGAVSATLDRVPVLKQLRHHVQPGLDMTPSMRTAWEAQGLAKAAIDTTAQDRLIEQLATLETAFGKGSATTRGFITDAPFIGSAADRTAITGTIADIAERPSLYQLTDAQKAALVSVHDSQSGGFKAVVDGYGLKVNEYPVADGGFHVAHVDVQKTALENAGSLESALRKGRTKNRVYGTLAERMAADPSFQPETDIAALLNADNGAVSNMASRETFKIGVGGKTRLEVMQELNPARAKQMQSLKDRLVRLKGYTNVLKVDQQQAIDDFLASGVDLAQVSADGTTILQPSDLSMLQDALQPTLAPGRYVAKSQVGRDMASLNKEILGIKAQISALKPKWEGSLPYSGVTGQSYNLVKDGGVWKYFPTTEAKQLSKLLETTDNKFWKYVDMGRQTAFGGDFSPVTIQGQIVALSDPVGFAKMIVSKDLGFTQQSIVDYLAKYPEVAELFPSSTGINPLGGVGQEFGSGFMGKIPKVGKKWEAANEALYRPVQIAQMEVWRNSYQAGLEHGLTKWQASAVAASDSSRIVPRINTRLLGQSQAQATHYRAALTSVSFLTQPAALMTEATKGMVKLGLKKTLTRSEIFAVKRMVTLAAAVTSISVLSNVYYAKSHGLDPEDAALESLTPGKGRFMSLVLPNGVRIGLGGPYRSLVNAVAPRSLPGVPTPIPFAGIGSFAQGKIGPVPKIAWDEIANKDFYGKQIRTGNFPVNILQGLRYAGEGSVPLTLGTIDSGFRRKQSVGDTAQQVAGQFAGVNLKQPSIYAQANDWAKANGVNLEAYNAIPASEGERLAKLKAATTPAEKAKYSMTRDDYRTRNPKVDAILFVTGQTASLKTVAAKTAALNLIRENKIDLKDIKGLEAGKYERTTDTSAVLRKWFQAQLGQAPTTQPSTVPSQPSRSSAPATTPGTGGMTTEYLIQQFEKAGAK